MNELLKLAIKAQGGLDQWRKFNTFTARFINSGELWTMKGHGGTIDEVGVKVNLLEQKTSHIPNDQWHTAYTPDKIAIESADGDTIAELYNPRASYSGHVWETEWTPLQLAYFTGYATWNYINTPYQFTRPGFELSEGELWEENGEVLRTLKVKWPKDIHTHCSRANLLHQQRRIYQAFRLPGRCGRKRAVCTLPFGLQGVSRD
jgi:hypothetical protein